MFFRSAVGALCAGLIASSAVAAERIEFMFPAPVQGKLSREMQKLVKEFNSSQSDVEVVGVFTGSYDETKVKSQAAAEAGKPPAVVLMSANFATELAMNDLIVPMEQLAGDTDLGAMMEEFWPAVRPNAHFAGKVYSIPFQNSTPILYYNKEHFAEAGISKAPETWAEWVDAAKKLTKADGERWGIMMPSNYDYNGWLVQALTMANGGQFYNNVYPGEIFYDHASTQGALKFWRDFAHQHKAMPTGVTNSKQVSTAFFSGKASMIVLSTGALTFVRENAKFDYDVAFMPRNIRNSVPIGGASLVSFKGTTNTQKKAAWSFISWLTSAEKIGHWSRFTGYFAPRKTAYDLPEMKKFVSEHPDALRAVEQLAYAGPWIATYNTVAVRKAVEDEMQALLSDPELTFREAAARAQENADKVLAPYAEQTALSLQ
ncbi:ABC transporter substrate-binding protein [Nisaea acidiphila]|uniref:ABC transporter substrate-binding protein n=1 Tax=Nisaea acidiphila TaxID=1862145 RepID=A0A9J7AN25_9PROT|nr:ABC transporter substrate-binding protein [Nisaea acidiphila]UUX48848.1 ABC transporter substrate-binding protein [Nisaea acidiphila]